MPTFEYADPKRTPPPRRSSEQMLAIATFIWQAFIAIVLPVGVGVLCAFTMSVLLGFIFGLLTAVLIFTTARSSQLARRRRALIVLSHIDTTIRMNLPISITLRRWAQAETHAISSLLLKTAEQLDRGAWMSDALRNADVDLPARIFDQLAAAERAGRLATTIDQLLRQERERRANDPSRRPFVRVYSIILLMFIPAIAMVIAIFVMPKFAQIMKDFRLPVPWVMRLMIELTRTVAPILAALGILLFVVGSQVATGEISRARPRRWLVGFRGLIDRLRWITPLLGRLDRDRGWADVCQTVAEGLDAQRPMNAVVAEARQPHLNLLLARRVSAWSDGLEQGLAPGEAAAAARLPAFISGMLGRERDVPNVAATLHFLARYYGSRFGRLQLLVRESGVPLLALAGGACVLFIALSIFTPMMMLVEKVSLPWPRP